MLAKIRFSALTGAVSAVFVHQAYHRTTLVPQVEASTKNEISPKSALLLDAKPFLGALANESPKVFIWGDNSEGLIQSDLLAGSSIRVPMRVPCFDGLKLRDLAVCPAFGLAALNNGDVVQFTKNTVDLKQKTVLKGQSISKLLISPSSRMCVALSSKGSVWNWSPETKPVKFEFNESLGWFEQVVDIQVGVDHLLALTNKGRVLAGSLRTASNVEHHGQFGIAAFPHFEGMPPAHKLYKIKLINQPITKIACGDYHSLFITKSNELWGCGSNKFGQLMLPYTYKNSKNSVPIKLSYNVTDVAAGSNITLFKRVSGASEDAPIIGPGIDAAKSGALMDTNSLNPAGDWFVAGDGEYGQFGTGSFAQCQQSALRIKTLSNMREYDEVQNQVVPVDIKQWKVGATHIYAQMGGATRDWLVWGSNERGQLGNNKLSKIIKPLPVGSIPNFEGARGYEFAAGDKISGCFVKC